MTKHPLVLVVLCACGVDELGSQTDVVVPDGTHGRMDVRFNGGALTSVPYVVRNNHAFWQDDIDLGPPPDPLLRTAAIRDLGARWTNATVPFEFESEISTSAEQVKILTALNDWEERTPLKFTRGCPGLASCIHFGRSDTANVSWTNEIGMPRGPFNQVSSITLVPNASERTVVHEIGHALGLIHEQNRPNRDDSVRFSADCTQSDYVDQFDAVSADGFENFGPYDFDSVMEYGSTAFCVQNPLPGVLPEMANGHCVCYPLVARPFQNDQEGGFFSPSVKVGIDRSSGLTGGNVRAMNRMYEKSLGAIEANDLHGAAFAVGDFDGDGFLDLAVGAPGEGVGSAPKAGAVFIYRGTEAGLVAWKVLAESDVVPTLAAGGDQFGSALAVGDFNNDGIADLVIGAPHARGVSTTQRGGLVVVAFGDDNGPRPGHIGLVDQSSTTGSISQDGDQFGAAIAVADLNGDGIDDLVIGVPGETVNGVRSGWVNTVVSNGLGLFMNFGGVGEPASLRGAGDRFGTAVVAADFDNDGNIDIAVGAPDGSGKSGKVFVYRNTGTGWTAAQTIDQATGDGAAPGDRFGAALAVGDFDGTVYSGTSRRRRELAIGAPGKGGSGRVFVMWPKLVSGITWIEQQLFGQGIVPGGSNQSGDVFGSALAVNAHSDFDDLAVGAPGKMTTTGLVLSFTGSSSGLVGSKQVAWSSGTNNGSLEIAALGDGLGSSLAFGDFAHDGQTGGRTLVSGLPGRKSSSGAFVTFQPGDFSFGRYRDQTTASPE